RRGRPGSQSTPRTVELERDPGIPASTWRLRSDAWEYLKFAIKRLSASGGDFSMIGEGGEVWRCLRALRARELYWGGAGEGSGEVVRDPSRRRARSNSNGIRAYRRAPGGCARTPGST